MQIFILDDEPCALKSSEQIIKKVCPAAEVTAFEGTQDALQKIREEIEVCGRALPANEERQLKVRCFGYFEVFWQGEPLLFARRQTKELLAYLINRNGTVCTAEEIAAALWEDDGELKAMKARIRILLSDLRKTLKEIGMDDLIIRRSGRIAIRRESLDCDYFRMLYGDPDAVKAFRGDYMLQYSWAELTAGRLMFRKTS